MQNTPRRDSRPELALRSEVHRLGLRYRVDVALIPGSRRRGDLVFRPSKVVVFVDGCFWHCCPIHGSVPGSNVAWWTKKLTRNKERDLDTNKSLEEAGWRVLRVWEHEDPKKAAKKIERIVSHRLNAQFQRKMRVNQVDRY